MLGSLYVLHDFILLKTCKIDNIMSIFLLEKFLGPWRSYIQLSERIVI